MSEIQKYIKILNIKCSRCLDTKILWKGRDNVFWARMDGRGDYDVLHCDKCSGGGWNRCSHTTDIYARGIHAFHVADGEWHVLETLRPLVKPYLDHIAQMEAEAERIKQAEADRIMSSAREQITNEKNAAVAELKNQVATLSIEIAEKILRSELSSDEKQKALVNNLMKDVNLN